MINILNLIKKYLIKYKGQAIIYGIISIVLGIIAILQPLINGNFIDNLIKDADNILIFKYGIIYGLITFFNIFLGYISNRIYVKLQTKISYEFNKDVIKHLRQVNFFDIQNFDAAYLTQRINNDCNTVIIFCINLIQDFVVNLIKLIFPMLLVMKLNIKFSVLLCVGFFCYYIVYKFFKEKLYIANYKFIELRNQYFNELNNQLKYIYFIKIHSLGERFFKFLEQNFYNMYNAIIKLQNISYFFSSLNVGIQSIIQMTIFIWGGFSIIKGTLTIGNIITITSYSSYVIMAGGYFFNISKKIQEIKPCLKRLLELLDIEIQKDGTFILKEINTVELRNLSFHYSSKKIINKFNYIFKKGKIYLLTGENGSGKTTLINLIIGLHNYNYKGNIYINGLEQRIINMEYLRKNNISICEQEPLLLYGNIYDNIALLNGINDIEKINILKKNLSLNEMDIFKQKIINERKSNISGGEKQIVALLRTFYKKANLIILDEPSSALDSLSFNKLKKYIKSISNNKIILIISHNEAFNDIADEIIKIERKEL